MRKPQEVIYVILGLGIIAVILNVIAQSNLITGDWNSITTSYLGVLGFLILIALGFYWLIRR